MGNSVGNGQTRHLQRHLQRLRAVVDARQDVAVEIDHVFTGFAPPLNAYGGLAGQASRGRSPATLERRIRLI
jgi:hypothetical protein